MKKNDIILFVAIFLILSFVVGGTYAYWTWNSATNKSVVFNTSASIQDYVVYDGGESYFVGNFQPTSSYCDAASNTISFYKTAGDEESGKLVATINMDVNDIAANTSASSDVYWVITSGDASACPGTLASALNYGTFNGVQDGAVITLLPKADGDAISVTTTKQTFTIWIWIDSAGSNLSLLSGETIDTNIWTQIDMLDASAE